MLGLRFEGETFKEDIEAGDCFAEGHFTEANCTLTNAQYSTRSCLQYYEQKMAYYTAEQMSCPTDMGNGQSFEWWYSTSGCCHAPEASSSETSEEVSSSEAEGSTEVTVVFELSYDAPLADKATEEQNIQSGIVNSTGLASDQVDVDMQLKETRRRLLASVYETTATFHGVEVDDLDADAITAAVEAAAPSATVTVTRGPAAGSTGCSPDGDCEEYYYVDEGVCYSESTLDDKPGQNCRTEPPTDAVEGSAALLIPNIIAIISVIFCAAVAY
jgi:hypothetical protein